eukprot:1233434-Prymnesium_polylepis.1
MAGAHVARSVSCRVDATAVRPTQQERSRTTHLWRRHRLAQQQLRQHELLVRQLAQQVLGLVAVHALILRVEARRSARLALGRLVQHQFDARARLDDANLEKAATEIDADHRRGGACGQAEQQKRPHGCAALTSGPAGSSAVSRDAA